MGRTNMRWKEAMRGPALAQAAAEERMGGRWSACGNAIGARELRGWCTAAPVWH